ncbi:hypothetical protein Vadar_021116 [Vaccinium darrowii]|uniref:Uncharacterized protein n=1 Tax=Vaccinium darrowii TaxID=229202 RepID=A0ACB7ZE79_9ERIC|nr:hypothetical protein Vadar_021116 [Vaccinium darrowii]
MFQDYFSCCSSDKTIDQCMAPKVFKQMKYDNKVDVFSFAMILFEMLEGDPPLSQYEPYEAAKLMGEDHRPSLTAKGFTSELIE